jgi:lipid-binding SYLF domain-containing protein
MNRSMFLALVLAGTGMAIGGCATAPKTDKDKEVLHSEVEGTLNTLKAADPSFEEFLRNAYAYVVFPNVGKGGLGVGAAFGRGEVYEGGRMIGYASLEQATIGLQIGGQNFAEVIAFEGKEGLDRFMSNRLEMSAQATAVGLRSGIARTARYTDGVAVFVHIKGGLMAEASVGGQRFTFTPGPREDRNRD